MSKIIILGGSFNPIHTMHSYILEEAFKQLKCDDKYYLINNIPPHKEHFIISNHHRLEMIKLQCQEDNSKILTYELENKEISYTYKTMKYYKKKYPKWEIYFLIGQDNINSLDSWYKIEELKEIVTFVGVNRKDYENLNKNIDIYIDIEISNISSTAIRNGNSSSLSDNVKKYIISNNLYGY